jgi:hypothetical protein
MNDYDPSDLITNDWDLKQCETMWFSIAGNLNPSTKCQSFHHLELGMWIVFVSGDEILSDLWFKDGFMRIKMEKKVLWKWSGMRI